MKTTQPTLREKLKHILWQFDNRIDGDDDMDKVYYIFLGRLLAVIAERDKEIIGEDENSIGKFLIPEQLNRETVRNILRESQRQRAKESLE